MKNKMIFIVVCLLTAGHFVKAESIPEDTGEKDTIEIKFGEKGKILIQVENKDDLEALKNYDFNSMLDDIEVPTSEEMNENEKVILQDDQGTKYLKDSVDSTDEFRQLENEFDDSELEVGEDAEQQEKYNYERKAKRFSGSKTQFISVLDFGINNFLENGQSPNVNNEQYTVRPWGSWYVGIMPTWQAHISGKFALAYGAGISWYNYKFQDPRTKLVAGQDGTVFEQWDVELNATKSKLTVAHLNAHLVPMFDFGYRTNSRIYDDGFEQKRTRYRRNGLRIGAGAYVGTRIDGYQKLVWRGTGQKSMLRNRDNFHLENFRYGARFILGYGEVDIFVNYDLSTVFAKNKGPELNSITFGFSF